MLCQMCHKNLSTVRYAEVVSGKVTDVHLCADCLARYQQNESTGFGLAAGTIPSPMSSPPSFDTVIPSRACPSCGTDMTEVLNRGRAGCSVCYESFGEQLDPVLRGLHFALVHRGKIPRQTDSRARARADLQKKRALLRSSLKLENYEEAASLRDEIKTLEESLGLAGTAQE
ncbi:MAG: UvrB/UvrC motif-containing protein [Candidatus Hydrogenedentes bacterium]|nr:UvrB/UvrC motif-containing protein [Candidatus Hydrogenedentota bacterium]